ncbi:MAG TPA: hypothetical protein VGE26_09120 [Sphingobacteriaceae bacterium]
MYTVERNVPVPNKEDTWKSKLDALQIGESFIFPEVKRNSVRQNISGYFHRLTAKRFTVSVKGQTAGTARVWRIEDAEVKEGEN